MEKKTETWTREGGRKTAEKYESNYGPTRMGKRSKLPVLREKTGKTGKAQTKGKREMGLQIVNVSGRRAETRSYDNLYRQRLGGRRRWKRLASREKSDLRSREPGGGFSMAVIWGTLVQGTS